MTDLRRSLTLLVLFGVWFYLGWVASGVGGIGFEERMLWSQTAGMEFRGIRLVLMLKKLIKLIFL